MNADWVTDDEFEAECAAQAAREAERALAELPAADAPRPQNVVELRGHSAVRSLPESWKRIDMTAAVSVDYTPEVPTMGAVDGIDLPLLYQGRVNMLFGESGGGKGLVSMALMVEQIRAGKRVAMLDLEDNEGSVAGRLIAHGLTPQQMIS